MVDQTFATAIRDGALSRLQAAPPGGVVAGNITTTPLPPMQGDAVPAMRVLLLSEDMTPDGDFNVGEPRFIHDATIGLSAVSVANSEGETSTNIDAIVNDALTTLLCDGTFMELFEGITAIRRSYSFPNQGESYFAEVRLQLTVRFKTVWPPNAPYALDEIDVYPVPAFGPAPTVPIIVEILPQSDCLNGVAGIGLAGVLGTSGPPSTLVLAGLAASGNAGAISNIVVTGLVGVAGAGVAMGASGGIAPQPSGVTASGAAGSFGAQPAMTIGGVAATGAVGTMPALVDSNSAGVAGTGAAGTISFSGSYELLLFDLSDLRNLLKM